jgi:5-(carboxyamino)imidazole ribonucleotide synthase
MEKRIAILGAGQLAKYLNLAARKLNLPVTIVATSASEPACQDNSDCITQEWTADLMLNVFNQADLVTFENEWISESLLSKVKAAGLLNRLTPSFESMERVRTKWGQKELFYKLKYPTAKTLNGNELLLSEDEKLVEVLQGFHSGFVIKQSELAYDGKGVFVFDSKETEAFRSKAVSLNQKNVSWYVEEKIGFEKELALVFTRNLRGDFVHYPLAEFFSQQGICSSVFVEGKNQGLMLELEKQAVAIARDLSQKLNWCGTAALEFFYSEAQGLLINEFAPRVHNSGHFSLSASKTSQFENHLRAIAGLPLGPCETAPFAAMKNLIGTQKSKNSVPPDVKTGVEAFWYGKKEIRPGRKMGHVNAFGGLQDRDNIVDKVNRVVEDWEIKTAK